jgi:E3 ubiquitin-protein ligase CCNP1IP1
MYDQLRNEFDSVKRSAIQPASNFYSRNERDLFSNPPNILDERETGRKGKLLLSTLRGYCILASNKSVL